MGGAQVPLLHVDQDDINFLGTTVGFELSEAENPRTQGRAFAPRLPRALTRGTSGMPSTDILGKQQQEDLISHSEDAAFRLEGVEGLWAAPRRRASPPPQCGSPLLKSSSSRPRATTLLAVSCLSPCCVKPDLASKIFCSSALHLM
jgi:hypothetical protein